MVADVGVPVPVGFGFLDPDEGTTRVGSIPRSEPASASSSPRTAFAGRGDMDSSFIQLSAMDSTNSLLPG